MNIASSDLLDFILKNTVTSTDLLNIATNIIGNGSFNGNNQGNLVPGVTPSQPA